MPDDLNRQLETSIAMHRLIRLIEQAPPSERISLYLGVMGMMAPSIEAAVEQGGLWDLPYGDLLLLRIDRALSVVRA